MRLKHAVVLVAGAAGVILALAVVDLLRVKFEIDRGRDRLGELDLEVAATDGGIERLMAGAHDHLARADDIARSSPWLDLVGAVPGADDQVEAVRDLTGASRRLGTLARDAAAELTTALDAADTEPAGRVALLDVAIAQVDRVSAFLADLDYGGDGFLVPPFSMVRDTFADEIAESSAELTEARRAAVALRAMLDGPSRYLLLAATNAEMTAGSGMTNSVGMAVIEHGDVSVAEFTPSNELWLGYDGVRAPGDLDRLYGKMAIGVDYRGTTSSPNFPVVGSLYARMAARTPEIGPVDGVFVVDALLLRDLVDLTGPVEVGGVRYTGDDLADEILNRNYLRYPELEDRPERTKLQSDLAVAVFNTLKTRSIGLAVLAKTLRDAALARHLLAWSADRDLQNLWRDLGAAGAIGPDNLGIFLQNYGGNKIDYYLKPTAVLGLQPDPDGTGDWRARLSVTVENAERNPTSFYIEGYTPESHFVFLDLHLPKEVYRITPVDWHFEGTGRDGPMQVVTLIYPVPKGETVTVSVDFNIPDDLDFVELIPSARLHPLILRVFGKTYTDAGPTRITLPNPPPLPPTGLAAHPELVLAAMLALGAALSALSAYRGTLAPAGHIGGRAVGDATLARALGVAAVVLVVFDAYSTLLFFAS